MKKIKWPMVVVSGLLLCAGAGVVLAGENQTGSAEFSIPNGNAARGRSAFQSLNCVVCHRVAADPDLPKPVNETPAPTLAFGPDTDNAVIAQSVIAPSHSIAYGYGKGDPEEPQKSPMIDLTNDMTVRQMIDIIAYLKSDSVPSGSPDGKS